MSTTGIRAAFVGNCQARPLANAIATLAPGVAIAGIAVVHLLDDTKASEFEPVFAGSDFIFAQRVIDKYPCSFVRTRNLELEYGEKVISWPNLYFSGYNPELFYLKGPNRRNAVGPLSEYHVREIYQTWSVGKTVADAIKAMTDLAEQEKRYSDSPDESIRELATRERDTRVKVSEWVAERRWGEQLFLTFNHPSNALLYRTALQLLKLTGIPMEGAVPVATKNEPLGKILCPINPFIKRKYDPQFPLRDSYRGIEIEPNSGKPKLPNIPKIYELGQLIETFFGVYDATAVPSQAAIRS